MGVITRSQLSSHLDHLSVSHVPADFPGTAELGLKLAGGKVFLASCINSFCCQTKMPLVQFITRIE